MFDIHCHILPIADEGPSSMEEAMHRLKLAYRDGVRELVATPSIWRNQLTSRESVVEAFSLLRDEALKHLPDLVLHLGFEVYLSESLFEPDKKPQIKELHRFVLGNSRSILVAFDRLIGIDRMLALIQVVVDEGLIPVVAHAEGYESLHFGTTSLEKLREAGALIQVCSGSVLGMSGYAVKKWVKTAMSYGFIDFVASDEQMPNGVVRQLGGSAYNDVKWQFGSDLADRLFLWNGQWLLQGADQKTLHMRKNQEPWSLAGFKRSLTIAICFLLVVGLIIGSYEIGDQTALQLGLGNQNVASVELEDEAVSLGAPNVSEASDYLRKNGDRQEVEVDRSAFDALNASYEKTMKALANEGVSVIRAEATSAGKAKLYNSYLEALDEIEKESDEAVQILLNKISEQLSDREAANDLVKSLWTEYLLLKRDREHRWKTLLLKQH